MDKILSIVIISMNNLADLIVCVDSIYEFNDAEVYDIYLVAFNYTIENLEVVKSRFPKVFIVRSEGIRGFSENNNLALKLVESKYCLILNDDTYFTDNSIEALLICAIDNDIKILSPVILNFDGTIQLLGRPDYNLTNFILRELKLLKLANVGNTDQNLFKTYNISGACFLIKFEYFKELGLFDERYFFTPEDIALSAKSCRLGNNPFVFKSAKVYHKHSSTAAGIHHITIPVGKQGIYLYLKDFYGTAASVFARCFIFSIAIVRLLYWQFIANKSERQIIMRKANLNCSKYAFSNLSPKQLFYKLYSQGKT